MNEFALARVLHVLGVVLWIGGVAMVTTVLLPSVRRMKTPEERVAFFEELGKITCVPGKTDKQISVNYPGAEGSTPYGSGPVSPTTITSGPTGPSARSRRWLGSEPHVSDLMRSHT